MMPAPGIQRQKRVAPLPGPLFHQAQIEAEFAEREPDESRMWAERMMQQREHAVLEYFAVLKKTSTARGAPNYISGRTRQPVFLRF
jgi:hypothetical protein